jgi:spore coat polysaccharide biosynthesis predicted glycosyltransferase SpsG
VRVLFRCDAGRDDGLGHVMRCLTLADAMRLRGETVTFCSLVGPQMVGAERIEARGYSCIAAEGPAASPADSKMLATLPRDVLVIDSRRATAAYLNAAAMQGFTVVIDDEGMVGLNADVVLNTALDGGAGRYPHREGRQFDLFGPRYNLIDPAMFGSRPPAAKAQRLLVTFGGEDPFNHTRWVLENLASTIAGLEVTIVIGPAHPDAASARMAAVKARALAIEAPPSLVPYILNTDLAVTAGGTTCYELAAAGVPMLVIGIEPHQGPLIHALAARSACRPLGMGSDIDVAEAGEALRCLIDDGNARNEMWAAQQALFPGPGAPLVVDAIKVAWSNRRGAAYQAHH